MNSGYIPFKKQFYVMSGAPGQIFWPGFLFIEILLHLLRLLHLGFERLKHSENHQLCGG